MNRRPLYSAPVPKKITEPKVRWRLLPILWMALKRTCMLLGAFVFLSFILFSCALSSAVKDVNTDLPDKMVLFIELDGMLGDVPQDVSLTDPFSQSAQTVKTFIDALEKASNDSRVAGIYAKMSSGGYALAHMEELRTAIKDFRQSGKFAYIYASSYQGGLGAYYMATAFDEIWMQPMGIVMATGLNAEIPFFRSVLDKIGVEPNMFKRKEYKSAYDSVTNNQISDAHREEMQVLIGDMKDVLVSDIAADRNITVASLTQSINKGVLLSQEALDAGLVDRVEYSDKLVEHINMRVTGNPKDKDALYVRFAAYIKEMNQGNKSAAEMFMTELEQAEEKNVVTDKPAIALVYAVGAIMDENKGRSGGIAAADEISSALLRAADDENIKAVVLRINSPGGSPVASETILRAVRKNQETGKKVIVSMGPAAASGGYWIATYADQIFVLPTTITGSIGVLGGKFSAQELWANLGVNWERISWGKNSGMWSMNTPFSESEAAQVNMMLDNVYENFVERVSKGRKMPLEDVEKIARGRVWTGKKAVDIGLADQFGGLNEALDYAAVQIGLTKRQDAEIVILPRPLTAIEQFVRLLDGQVRAGQMINAQAPLVEALQPFLNHMSIMGDAQNNSVYAPVAEIR